MPKRKVDRNALLTHIRQDARKSFVKIAKDEGLAVSTVFEHVKSLEREGVIDQFTCLLDHAALGFPFRSFLYSTVDDRRLESFLRNRGNVNSLFRTHAKGLGADILFRSLAEEESFREELNALDLPSWELFRVVKPVIEESWLPHV